MSNSRFDSMEVRVLVGIPLKLPKFKEFSSKKGCKILERKVKMISRLEVESGFCELVGFFVPWDAGMARDP